MRICIQMLYTQGWLELAKVTTPNIVNYCRKHGYTWNIQCIKEPYDAFEKIRQIQSIFENNEADAVWSLDCDAIITNYTKKVEDYLNEEDYFYVCKDYNGINCGSFIVVKSEWSIRLLEKMIWYSKYDDIHCEQDALQRYIKIRGCENIKKLPHPSINSYLYKLYPEIPMQTEEQGQWANGKSFILHLPGVGMDTRISIMKDILKDVVYE